MAEPPPRRPWSADPVEVEAARLVRSGLAWPLARGLAPWIIAVDRSDCGDMNALLKAVRVSTSVVVDWIVETETTLVVLRDACANSLALAEALDAPQGRNLVRHRAEARAALRTFTVVLRGARPSLWARKHGLGW